MTIFSNDREILLAIAGLRQLIQQQGAQMAVDFTKLQAADAALAAAVQTLSDTVASESAKIQAALNALSTVSTDVATQAAIDAETTKINASVANIGTATAAVNAEPTTPTPATT